MLPLPLPLPLSTSLPQSQHQLGALQAPPGCGLHFKLAHLVESVGNSSPSQPVRQSWPALPAATATSSCHCHSQVNPQLPLPNYHLFFYLTFFSSVASVKCLFSFSHQLSLGKSNSISFLCRPELSLCPRVCVCVCVLPSISRYSVIRTSSTNQVLSVFEIKNLTR